MKKLKQVFMSHIGFISGLTLLFGFHANASDECSVQSANQYKDKETQKLVLWVAPKSQQVQCGKGTKDSPLNSIAAAQKIAQQWISQKKNSHGIEVNLLAGDYVLSEGLVFTQADSGFQKAPVVYQGVDADKVRLFGGLPLAPSSFTSLKDGDFKNKLVDKSAAKHIKQMTLPVKESDLGEMVPHGWMLEPKGRVAPAMLYSGGDKMVLSRWPNVDESVPHLDSKPTKAGHLGMVSYKKVINPGANVKGKNRFTDPAFTEAGGTFSVEFDRIKHWNNPSEIFIDGILARSWEWTYNQLSSIDVAKQQITLRRGELSGISANKGSYFHFENIPEELNAPGEFYIDKESKTLYFYPTEDFEQKTTVLATLATPMIYVDKARFIQFKSMSLDTGRAEGVRTNYAHNLKFSDLVIRNFSGNGVHIVGTYNELTKSHISNVGGAGVHVAGGWGASFKYGKGAVAETLKQPIKYSSANNKVTHNVIHNFAWDQKSQVPGISLSGIGHKVMFNEIFDGPHFAILFRSTQDVTAAYNYIYDLPKFHKDDGGAIYVGTGNFPHLRGINISGNVLKDIPTNGIYIDNFSSGVQIERNMMHNVGTRNHTFSGININGGGQNMMRHNWISESPRPIKYNTFAERNVFKNYYPRMKGIQDAFKKAGGAIAPYDGYPDFAKFMDYKTKNDFLYQSSSALSNVSLNRVVALQKGTNKGVIEPKDQRWDVRQNVALKDVNGKVLELVRLVNSVFAEPSDNWAKNTQTIAEYLPTINDAIFQLTGGTVTQSPQQARPAGSSVLISNGDFSYGSDDWAEMKATADIDNHSECTSGCLKITDRVSHIGSAVYTVKGLVAGKTYRFAADLKTQSPMVGIGYSFFKGKKFTNGGWNQGMKVKSDGEWIKQQYWDIKLPDDFNSNRGLRIWVRTGGSKIHDIFIDNASIKPL